MRLIFRQGFVIAGYVPRPDSSKSVGPLVLGYHDGSRLIYALRVASIPFRHARYCRAKRKMEPRFERLLVITASYVVIYR
jgi:hypothetical protein